MSGAQPIFLPGVPEDKVRAIFGRAAGNEIASGKFASPQSSAALAANGFGWFLDPLDERAEWEAGGAHGPLEEPRLEPGKMAWWFGFDTDKPGDLWPIDPPLHQPGAEAPVYREIGYVFTEVVSLARQLHALADADTPLALAPPPQAGVVVAQGQRRQDTGAVPAAPGDCDPRRSGSRSPAAVLRQNPMLPGRTGGDDDQA